MTILDTFTLLFKSDTKQARNEIEALEAKQEELRKKGKARTAQESEELTRITKQRKELNASLETTRNQTEKVVESATKAIAAYVSLSAIKSGIVDTANLNRELNLQTALWGQNTGKIAQYNNALEALGGSKGSLLAGYQQVRDQYAAQGLRPVSYDQYIEKIRAQVLANPAQAERIFGQFGINNPADRAAISAPEDVFRKQLESQKQIGKYIEDAAPASEQYARSIANLNQSLTGFWSVINAQILPTVSDSIDAFTEMVKEISANKEAALGLVGVLVTVAGGGLLAGFGKLSALLSGGAGGGLISLISKFSLGLGGLARTLGLIGFTGSAAYAIGDGVSDIATGKRQSFIGRLSRKVATYINPDVALLDGYSPEFIKQHSQSNNASSGSIMEYLLGKGLSRNEAAAITANVIAESSGDPTARGDGGRASGLLQHHPDRVQAILKATGIDVRTADRNSQLDAIVYEAQNIKRSGFDYNKFSSLNADEAAAYFSRKFVSPADADGEAFKRARAALALANGSSLNSRSGNFVSSSNNVTSGITTGDIHVHAPSNNPQDLGRAVKNVLGDMLQSAHAQVNDSRNY